MTVEPSVMAMFDDEFDIYLNQQIENESTTSPLRSTTSVVSTFVKAIVRQCCLTSRTSCLFVCLLKNNISIELSAISTTVNSMIFTCSIDSRFITKTRATHCLFIDASFDRSYGRTDRSVRCRIIRFSLIIIDKGQQHTIERSNETGRSSMTTVSRIISDG
jgi:hypothetical protein